MISNYVYAIITSLYLDEWDPVGLLPQSRAPALPTPLTLLDVCAVVLRKRFHLLLSSEDDPELPPHLGRQRLRFSVRYR